MPFRAFLAVLAALACLIVLKAAIAQSIFERLVTPGPLIAKHAPFEALCSACHVPFSKATQDKLCLTCHKPIALDLLNKSGFHGSDSLAANQSCKFCHTDHKGRDADILALDTEMFDHQLTHFALTGRHASLPCAACHVARAQFRAVSVYCNSCHGTSDVHKGRLGSKCDDCHDSGSWLHTIPFDHGSTKFPLKGAHAQAECGRCHAGARYIGLPLTCDKCHQTEDIHRGSYGTSCQSCHDEADWRHILFDHASTGFMLKGAHAKIACQACHTGDLFKDKAPTTCIGCHAKDDVHKGGLGSKCDQCHGEVSWRNAIRFDHDHTRFPLVGRHQTLSCDKCHASSQFKGTPMTCAACHKDNFHLGRLGRDCASCHTPKGWLLWSFDHTRQTRFPLTGAHGALSCHDCHKQPGPTIVPLETLCASCHSQDDVHHGTFGPACDKCHSTSTFRIVRP
jgi:hypothetical protein